MGKSPRLGAFAKFLLGLTKQQSAVIDNGALF
jgi:hypothetical protein